ncbi:hypothetical protein WJX84_001431 [Apatococcus fuscideae]|uniref:Mis18 domain-containing protein n=1 Tax=Apatococcus fuscideae TaxID=2026836 RepID=A0AAW1RDN8_9CHLO
MLEPMVFFCSACRNILSDSQLYLTSHKDENVISVTGVCGASAVQSKQGRPGDTVLICQHCKAEVGKLMPGQSDSGRTAIWLHVSAISSHQLGTCDLRMPGSEHQNLSEGAADGAPGLGDTAGMRAMLQQQQTELLQVQSMLLLHHERLLQLEASSAAHSNPTQRKLDDQLDATLH